jgi:hypothetical protein
MTNSPFLLALSLLALAGCSSVPQEVELYNNTPATVAIKGCGSDEMVDPQVSASISAMCRSAVEIDAGDRRWRYGSLWRAWSMASMRENGEKTASGLYHLKLQLQPDGSIVVLPRGGDYPAADGARQPRDFPIRPD